MTPTEARRFIFERIISEVFVEGKNEGIADTEKGITKDTGWLFDFRRVVMEGPVIEALGILLTDTFKNILRYQLCGLEVAAIPIMTGITQYRYSKGDKNASGFFIRKSRKKEGLLRMVEGSIHKDTPIILVDDIMNSGKSFIRQVEVLSGLGYPVTAVWSILRFRDLEFHTYFKEKNIPVYSVFTLDDFTPALPVKNLIASTPQPRQSPAFTLDWKFSSPKPNLIHVIPKSAPTAWENKLYFGSDCGVFYCINQSDGTTVWTYTVGYSTKGKSIFSTPVVFEGIVYFGSYDGNLYALDAITGKRVWIFFDADWIGSSPVIDTKRKRIFIGLEFGLLRKRGGIAALDAKTGNLIWSDTSPSLTHATPCYIPEHNQVCIGSNDGVARLYDATSGEILWKFKTGDPSPKEIDSGFSAYDLKESGVYSLKNDLVIVGNMNGDVYGIDRKSGSEVWHFKAEFGIWGTPALYKNMVIVTSLDKHVYALDIFNGTLVWKYNAGARIFAAPILIEDEVFFGANTGRLTILDAMSGVERGYITVSERITNRIAYNTATQKIFLPTFANEIYCLSSRKA